MGAHNPPVSDEALKLGHVFILWRGKNGLSQQDLHNYGKDRGVSLYNSQIAYFERGLLTPKPAFFIALGQLMKDLKKNLYFRSRDFEFIQCERTKERLKLAVAFVNCRHHPATASDFFGMYIGQSPINYLYLKSIDFQKGVSNDGIKTLGQMF